MSSSAGFDSQLVPRDLPPSSALSVVPWSWPAGARVLLAGLVLAAGMGLAVAGWEDRATSEKVAEPPEFVLDVNHAPLRALTALPHLGPTLASRLVEARAEGRFSSLEDVRVRVRGIGPITLARIAPHLRIGTEPASPVRSETLARTLTDRPAESPRARRRNVTRARKRISTPRQPGLVGQAQGVDTRPDFTVADRE
jgi:competence protein ComEA